MSALTNAKSARHYRPAPHCAICKHYNARPGIGWTVRRCVLLGCWVGGLSLCDEFAPKPENDKGKNDA